MDALQDFEEYTLEIGENKEGDLEVRQFIGLHNRIAPEELYKDVEQKVADFNLKHSSNGLPF